MRVEPQELRIGNWITVMGSIPTQVTAYHLYMMETYVPVDPTQEADYKEMTNPVPLTEEWLLKFGFECNDEHEHPSFNEFILGVIEIGNFNDEYWLMEGLDQAGIDMEIKYVHQLQNLYFALTGEELTIKETV